MKAENPATGTLWKWLASALLCGFPYFLPFAPEIRVFLAITLAAIALWMFEMVSEAVVGILLPIAYILFKVTTPEVAFRGWSSSTPWVTIGALMVGTAFTASGIVGRIAYKVLIMTGGSMAGLVAGLSLTCLILTPGIPSIMGKAALMTPIVIGFCQALKVEKKSRTASVLMLTVFLALWSPKMTFMTASVDSVMTAGIIQSRSALPISWTAWAQDMFVPGILWTCLSVPLVFILRPEKISLDRSYFQAKYDALGPMTAREKRNLAMMALLLLAMATESLHGLDSTWLVLLAGCLCFFPGINLLKSEDFNKIPFSIVFFLVGAVAIGSATTSLGLAQSIADFVSPRFAGQSSLTFVMSLYVFAMAAVLLLNPLALIGTLMGPVADICLSLGYQPAIGGYIMIMGFNQAIFPYQVGPLMLVYGFGYLRLADLLKVMLVRIVLGLLFIPCVAYPYWKFMGLLH